MLGNAASCAILFLSKIFILNPQFGVVDKSIETDFRSTSSDKNCHQIWQQLQRQGQGATKKGGYFSQKLCGKKVLSCHFNDIFLRFRWWYLWYARHWLRNQSFLQQGLILYHSHDISSISIWHLPKFCPLQFDFFRLMQFGPQTILITVLICCKPHSLQIILKSFIIAIIRSNSSTISVDKYLKTNSSLTLFEEGYMYR